MIPTARDVSDRRSRSLVRGASVAAVLCTLSACAARAPAPVRPAVPSFPGFEFPAVTAAIAGVTPAVTARHEESWNLLQSGDTRAAARAFSDLARKVPGFYPALTGQAYAELANKDYKAAETLFAEALKQQPAYVPALAGRADALLAADRPIEAIAALEALLAADPSRAHVRERVEGLRLGSIERLVGEARAAQKRGDFAAARESWAQALTASPESGFMLRELAGLERQAGDLDAALAHAHRAAALEAQDAGGHALIGDIEAARGNLTGALEAYRQAATLDPIAYRDRVADVERRLALAALPEAFRAIAPSPQITRGDLAALLGVKLEQWLAAEPRPSAALITDVRGHWAQRWIMDVARAGLMEVYPNHTFQPGLVVRRGDLAAVVSRTLDALAARQPALAARWRKLPPAFADLPATHVVYDAAARAVSSGVMTPDPGSAFAPSRVVAGSEAAETIDRLASLIPAR